MANSAVIRSILFGAAFLKMMDQSGIAARKNIVSEVAGYSSLQCPSQML
jgi:hypothetical protein